MISYVLFKDKIHAEHLLKIRKFTEGDLEFIIKKVQDKQAKPQEAEYCSPVTLPPQHL